MDEGFKARMANDKARMRESVRRAYDRFLDEVQASIVLAGGRKMEIEEIEGDSFGEVVSSLLRNDVCIAVAFAKPPGNLDRDLRHMRHDLNRDRPPEPIFPSQVQDGDPY